MIPDPAEASQATATCRRADQLRDALEREFRSLQAATWLVVKSVCKGLRGPQLAGRVEEVLNESVCRALARPDAYLPDRPVVPWIMGIARNVLREEARNEARRRGRDAQRDLDEALLAALSTSGSPSTAAIDVGPMLSRLSPRARAAIECRFLRGLEGRELAEALGTTPGAARVRVSRALQDLRDIYARDDSEVGS